MAKKNKPKKTKLEKLSGRLGRLDRLEDNDKHNRIAEARIKHLCKSMRPEDIEGKSTNQIATELGIPERFVPVVRAEIGGGQ